MIDSGQNLRKLFFRERNQGKNGKSHRIQGYNSKIISADKDWREEVLKLDQFYLGFVPPHGVTLVDSVWFSVVT